MNALRQVVLGLAEHLADSELITTVSLSVKHLKIPA